MNEQSQFIHQCLQQVESERLLRLSVPGLLNRVQAVKGFQHARFEQNYADLQGEPRYAKATAFFLEDIYSSADFSERDAQFARIVPALVRLFPRDIVATVAQLAELHALSERLDTAMAGEFHDTQVTAPTYAAAWRAVGEPQSRQRQVELMLAVGSALDRYTRKPFWRQSLKLMRGPAQAAGLGALQQMLEKGFDTFRGLEGAQEFLNTISLRETNLSRRLFAGENIAC